MSKVHVLPDENLGGVLREYVEVKRKAKKGEKVIAKVNDGFRSEFRKGDIFTASDAYYRSAGEWCVDFLDNRAFFDESEYRVLEPTDIVHIDGKRYRMVERRVGIGEKVLITIDSELKGIAFTVSGFDSDGDLVFKESDYYYAEHGDYVVLEAVEQSPPVLDMLANLSEQIVKLNRRIDRLADANEQAITTVARDVERVDADLIKLRKEIKDSKDVTLTLSSELVAKLIEKGLSE